MIRILNEEIFYVSRENSAACVCGRAFLCAYFWPNEIHLVKKKAAEGVCGHFLLPLYAARQGFLHLAVAYVWGVDCRPVALKPGRKGCLFTCNGGSEPFNRLLETNMVAACWLMMLRTETAK